MAHGPLYKAEPARRTARASRRQRLALLGGGLAFLTVIGALLGQGFSVLSASADEAPPTTSEAGDRSALVTALRSTLSLMLARDHIERPKDGADPAAADSITTQGDEPALADAAVEQLAEPTPESQQAPRFVPRVAPEFFTGPGPAIVVQPPIPPDASGSEPQPSVGGRERAQIIAPSQADPAPTHAPKPTATPAPAPSKAELAKEDEAKPQDPPRAPQAGRAAVEKPQDAPHGPPPTAQPVATAKPQPQPTRPAVNTTAQGHSDDKAKDDGGKGNGKKD